MTQKEKDLLLNDLCARLSHRPKIWFAESNSNDHLQSIWYDNLEGWQVDGDNLSAPVSAVKPYLFPLSSMTVEQRCKAQNLLPNKCEISFINSKITYYGEDCCEIKLEQFDKLFKFFDSQHVDYRGLIPMGLAIDATSKNIY